MPILIIGGLLIIFGILAIYSVSIYESFQLTIKLVSHGLMDDPSNYFYFFRQLKNLLIALFICLVIYKIPLKFISEHKNKIFVGAFILQLMVFSPLGTEFNGARGWLDIPGFTTVQPSEFFKLAFVVFLAGWLLKKKRLLNSPNGFVGFLVVIGLFFLVFLKIPDLGTILVLGPVALIMYRYVTGKLRYVIISLIVGLTMGLTVGMQFDYVKSRLNYFMNEDYDTSGKGVGWQIQQALVSIGGGGFFGKGYGKGLQKFGYIPEAQSDFVFAAFSEEIGLLGNSVLLTLYFLLAYFFLKRLGQIKDEYIRVFGVGIVSLIMVQVFVNVGVNTKLLPLTGLTLPFISFGGTALMVNLMELTLMYKILKESK